MINFIIRIVNSEQEGHKGGASTLSNVLLNFGINISKYKDLIKLSGR